jgi:phosphatidylserine/phosphatidylglycerophosphate/cardiolipin synthase-like enzyme
MDDPMLYVEPHAGVQPVVQLIRSARHSVDINAYLIDDRRILEAIRGDTRHGVRVRVVLPSRTYRVNAATVQREFNALAGTGAEIRWAPARFDHRFAYDHAKYIVVDGGKGETLVGTANLTYAAFHDNRDYLWIGHDRAVGQALETVFNADWNKRRAGAAPRKASDLVISPGGEQAMLKVLDQPGAVDLESEEFGFVPRISNALEHKGRLASIIVPNTIGRYDLGNLAPLQRDGVNVRFIRHPHMHAKMIVGDRLAFIGSQNISWTSLNHNREIGIILRGRAVAELRAKFNRDWRRASPRA